MTAIDELVALFEQWRDLTRQEGDAIKTCAWDDVAQIQGAKSSLQPRIVEVAQRVDTRVQEEQAQPIVRDIIQLEQSNVFCLRQKQNIAQAEKELLDKSSRNLRHLHRSYVPPVPSNWQSYS